MAKERKKVLHIHSNIPGKQPSPSQLEIGEIAVNTAEGKEFLSIKNSNENNSKIVRFSSDEQMVDWMEKKEVFPYSGSIDSVDDVNNTSNLVLKFNQKAASGTPHSSDVNNGSGFTINMDKYAMIGANPSFSSVTADVINGKQFETELTDDSDAKVPTSKAVADYTNDAISSYTEGKFALQSDLIKDERVISASLNDLNDRVEVLENTQVEIPTSITDLDEYNSNKQALVISGSDITSIEFNLNDSDEDKTYDNVINANGITLNYNDGYTNYDTTVSGGVIRFSDDDLGRSSKLTYDTLLLNDDSVDNSTTVTMNGVTITDGENTVKVDARSISADTIVARNLQEKELAISASLNDLNDKVDEIETNLSEEITTNKLNVKNINLKGSNEIIGKYDSDIEGDYLYLCGGEYIDLDNTVYIQKYYGGPGQLALFVNGDTVVNGTISANTITHTSDIKLKKNIESISYEKAVKANDLEIKQFNFINDETNRTIYGIIAQEAEELGLNEIVYGNETKSVDYNSLIMLKLAYLEKENKSLKQNLIKLSERISKLEKDN